MRHPKRGSSVESGRFLKQVVKKERRKKRRARASQRYLETEVFLIVLVYSGPLAGLAPSAGIMRARQSRLPGEFCKVFWNPLNDVCVCWFFSLLPFLSAGENRPLDWPATATRRTTGAVSTGNRPALALGGGAFEQDSFSAVALGDAGSSTYQRRQTDEFLSEQSPDRKLLIPPRPLCTWSRQTNISESTIH